MIAIQITHDDVACKLVSANMRVLEYECRFVLGCAYGFEMRQDRVGVLFPREGFELFFKRRPTMCSGVIELRVYSPPFGL